MRTPEYRLLDKLNSLKDALAKEKAQKDAFSSKINDLVTKNPEIADKSLLEVDFSHIEVVDPLLKSILLKMINREFIASCKTLIDDWSTRAAQEEPMDEAAFEASIQDAFIGEQEGLASLFSQPLNGDLQAIDDQLKPDANMNEFEVFFTMFATLMQQQDLYRKGLRHYEVEVPKDTSFAVVDFGDEEGEFKITAQMLEEAQYLLELIHLPLGELNSHLLTPQSHPFLRHLPLPEEIILKIQEAQETLPEKTNGFINAAIKAINELIQENDYSENFADKDDPSRLEDIKAKNAQLAEKGVFNLSKKIKLIQSQLETCDSILKLHLITASLQEVMMISAQTKELLTEHSMASMELVVAESKISGMRGQQLAAYEGTPVFEKLVSYENSRIYPLEGIMVRLEKNITHARELALQSPDGRVGVNTLRFELCEHRLDFDANMNSISDQLKIMRATSEFKKTQEELTTLAKEVSDRHSSFISTKAATERGFFARENWQSESGSSALSDHFEEASDVMSFSSAEEKADSISLTGC